MTRVANLRSELKNQSLSFLARIGFLLPQKQSKVIAF